MLFDSIISRGSTPVLERVLQFTQARHEVLTHNVSNFDTVGYKTQDLPAEDFYQALHQAARNRRPGRPLDVRTHNVRFDSAGRIDVRPVELENNNILFHDENNRFIEKQMSDLAQNALRHNVVAEMLRGKYNGLQTAIRGRL